MASGALSIDLDSEQKVLDTLKRVLDGSLDATDVTLDFTHADWAKFDLRLSGPKFHKSLTPSIMSGLIDYQTALYKSLALLTKNDPRINKLRDIEKTQLELIFIVRNGSSEIEADGKNPLLRLASMLADKMSGKQLLIATLVLGLMYFGSASFSAYLNYEAGVSKDDTQKETLLGLTQHDEAFVKAISDAVKASDLAAQVQRQSFDGFEALVRRSEESNGITLQGKELSKGDVQELNRQTRRSAKPITFSIEANILSVDSSSPDGFAVRIEDVDSGEIISASMFDPIVIEQYGRIIQSAEWDKRRIRVLISGRRIGEQTVEAKIIKVSRIRKPS